VAAFASRYELLAPRLGESAARPDVFSTRSAKKRAAFRRPPEAFEQVVINNIALAPRIGWHRYKPQFGEVWGFRAVSLQFPLRRRSGKACDQIFTARGARAPLYMLSGQRADHWEHSVLPLDRLLSPRFVALAKS